MLTDNFTEEKLAALKTCSHCQRTFPTRDFPATTARGYTVVRSWCRDCLVKYYTAYNRRRAVRK